MNVAAVETWLQAHTGLDASTLGAGVVARAARDRIDALKLKRVEDYLALLAGSAEERHTLIERVVVPETWFFRDRPAFDALARHIVDTWGPAHPGATFHLLSVPCSTGEEAYSLAIALALAGWPLSHLRIDAVDISRENLARARAGVYGKNSFRADDLSFRAAFCEPAGRDAWRVGESARAPVRFQHANLLADDFAVGRAPYDAIFCRNLLIYFDRPTQARAIRALDRLLAPGGWFAVGPAEPVLLFEHGYAALRVPGGFLLHRAPKPAKPPARPAPPAAFTPPPPPPPSRAAKPPKPATLANPPPPAPAPSAAASTAAAADTDALDAIRALADAGRLREAAERGAALLARGTPTAGLLHLLAAVADSAGDAARAEEFYRKVVFLDPQHTEALAHLALFAEKRGDLRAARQLRQRAQRHSLKEVG